MASMSWPTNGPPERSSTGQLLHKPPLFKSGGKGRKIPQSELPEEERNPTWSFPGDQISIFWERYVTFSLLEECLSKSGRWPLSLCGGGCVASHQGTAQAGRWEQEIREHFSACPTAARLTVLVQMCPRILAKHGVSWSCASAVKMSFRSICSIQSCVRWWQRHYRHHPCTLSSACHPAEPLHTFANIIIALWDEYYHSHFTDKESWQTKTEQPAVIPSEVFGIR